MSGRRSDPLRHRIESFSAIVRLDMMERYRMAYDLEETVERKIAFLMDRNNLNNVFDSVHLDRLSRMGKLSMLENAVPINHEQSIGLIKGAEIAITSWGCPPLSAAILDEAPDLKMIIHAAGTVKFIVTPEVIRREIPVYSSNSELGRRVAETTLGLTITSIKNIWQLTRDTREGKWEQNRAQVKELYNVTVGVIGAGSSGGHFIHLLNQFQIHIQVYDPMRSASEIKAMGATKVDLDTLLRESDVVSIHAPVNEHTDKLMNAERLQMMKDDAILINTARGSLVDEDALIAELKQGRLWACLDVTNPEPPAQDHPFRTLPNVTLIPHVAGVVNNGIRSLGEFTVNQLEAYAEGRSLSGKVQLEYLDSMG